MSELSLNTMIRRFSSFYAFTGRVLRRFAEESFDQLSASLAFTTLLSLVPLVAVVLGILSVLPVYLTMADELVNFARTLLPERNAGMIIEYLLEFSEKAAKVTLAGLAALIVTVLFLLFSVERAFNNIWRIRKARPWWKKLGLYTVVLALWPFMVTCVILAIYHAVSSSLGLIDHPAWLYGAMTSGAGIFVATFFFAGLYFVVPNARVEPRDALLAGLFASLGFMLMQYGFELYLLYFPSITLVYGTFATVPIFLMWMYLSWAVVVLGALVAATLPEFRRKASGNAAQDEGESASMENTSI